MPKKYLTKVDQILDQRKYRGLCDFFASHRDTDAHMTEDLLHTDILPLYQKHYTYRTVVKNTIAKILEPEVIKQLPKKKKKAAKAGTLVVHEQNTYDVADTAVIRKAIRDDILQLFQCEGDAWLQHIVSLPSNLPLDVYEQYIGEHTHTMYDTLRRYANLNRDISDLTPYIIAAGKSKTSMKERYTFAQHIKMLFMAYCMPNFDEFHILISPDVIMQGLDVHCKDIARKGWPIVPHDVMGYVHGVWGEIYGDACITNMHILFPETDLHIERICVLEDIMMLLDIRYGTDALYRIKYHGIDLIVAIDFKNYLETGTHPALPEPCIVDERSNCGLYSLIQSIITEYPELLGAPIYRFPLQVRATGILSHLIFPEEKAKKAREYHDIILQRCLCLQQQDHPT